MSEIVCLNIMRRDLSKTLTEEKKMTELLYIVTSVWVLGNENYVKKGRDRKKNEAKMLAESFIPKKLPWNKSYKTLDQHLGASLKNSFLRQGLKAGTGRPYKQKM